MKTKLITTLLLLTISTPAFAQSQAGFCKLWFTHKTEAKGIKGADYKPGVDVNGKAVAPADVQDKNYTDMVADVIRFPLTMDLAKQMHVSAPEGTEMKMPMGMVNIYRDGRVEFGDQDLSDQAYELCTGEKPRADMAETKTEEEPMPKIEAPKAPTEPEVPVVKAGKPEEASKGPISVAPKGDDKAGDIIWGEDY